MTNHHRKLGPAGFTPRFWRWAALCVALFCLGFTVSGPIATRAASAGAFPAQDFTPTPLPTATPGCEQRCNGRAEEVYKACIAAGRGADACEKEASTARANCMKECVKPTATPACEDRCKAYGEAVFKACIAAGRGEDVCHREANTARENCMKECPKPDATPTRKPEEPSCEQRCQARFDEVYKACIAAGRGPDACENEARTARENCMKECPHPDATPTRKPEEPSCEQRCKGRYEEVYKACIAAGRGADVCEREAKDAYNACVKECPHPDATPTRKPEEPSCEQRCKGRYEEVYKGCIAAGRGADVCEREAKDAYNACVKECPHPDATPTRKPEEPSCEQRCKGRYEEVYKACIAAGRGADVCEREAKDAYDACAKACPHPEGTKTPQPMSCEGRCSERAQAEFKACREHGGDEKTCRERANAVLKSCLDGCPKPTPKPEGCRERCNAKAEAVYKACIERGGGPDACFDEKTKAFNECFAACEHPTESCESGCKRRAEEVYKQCIAEGGEEAPCRERMRNALDVCLKGCPKPLPVDCQDRCAKGAREVLAKCLAEGGTQDACEARARESYDACLQHCDRPVSPAPIPDCSSKCARSGAAVFQKCMADGGTADACTERMAQEIQRCLTECLRPALSPATNPGAVRP